MKKAQWLTVMLVLGLVAALLGKPIPVDAGRPIGVRITIRSDEPKEVVPAVAYNSQWQEYLVVFWNDRPGNDDIRAERVSKDGKWLGTKWIAAGQGAERRYPDVAYNSKHNEYLVVWWEQSGGHSRILSQRFSADLTPQSEGVQTLFVSGSLGVIEPPALAYAYTADKYLVVWSYGDEFAATTPILGLVVSSNGKPQPSSGVFTVSADPGGKPRGDPDLAYNRHSNGFLVVWQQSTSPTISAIYGQLVGGDGGILPGSQPIKIADFGVSCRAPAVAAIPTAPGSFKYLVVWEIDWLPGNKHIFGRLVREDGTPNPSNLILAEDPVSESSPAVAGTEDGHEYLVTWRHPRGVEDVPIFGRTVAYDGVLVDDPTEFPGTHADHPALAAGPAGGFLVAWQDQPPEVLNEGIYGQLWGNRIEVFLPLILRGR